MKRVFLGWEGRLLEKAANWLVEQFEDNLDGVLVALPGAHSGRVLLEALARTAGKGLRPPHMLTSGSLSDQLLAVEGCAAERLVRTLAWEKALRELPSHELKKLVAKEPGASSEGNWAALADEVRGLFGEIAAEGLSFAELAKSTPLEELTGERRRWQTLEWVEQRMQALLDEAGLHDPHRARLQAIEAGLTRTPRAVVLVGVTEMNQLLARALEICTAPTTALVFAPESESAGFSSAGCLIASEWAERDLSLGREHWRVVKNPTEQAQAVASCISDWKGAYSAEQITCGLADPEVSPFLKSRLAESGVRARDVTGIPMEQTAVARLLGALHKFLCSAGFRDFSALVRHPDFNAALTQATGGLEVIEICDEYHGAHLPWHADGTWMAAGTEARDLELQAKLERLWQAVQDLTRGLMGNQTGTPKATAPLVRDFLTGIYGQAELDGHKQADRLTIAGLRCVGQALTSLEEIPSNLARKGSVADALGLLLANLANKGNSVPPHAAQPGEPTIEILGWLELPLDDAPALVVLGFSEGRVPEATRGDTYLPNSLRREIGLTDDEQRLARDLYATELLLRSREEVVFISGRRSLSGDPLMPSRLVFHCPPDEVAPRVRQFLAGGTGGPQRVDSRLAAEAKLAVGGKRDVPTKISVSAFKTFLNSPYNYYLIHVLGLESLDDRAREMSSSNFGNLAHHVLERFGQNPKFCDERDEKKIEHALLGLLDELGFEIYGKGALPAVRLQLSQLAWRLSKFARQQAQKRAEGWRIRHVEWRPESGGIELLVDEEAIELRGSIDRIDQNESSGEWAIWDYKTGENVADPLGAHRAKSGEWKDLQLPLYAHLSQEITGTTVPKQLGYIGLGRAVENIGFRPVKSWCQPKGEGRTTSEIMEDATEVARQIVRKIRQGDFFEVGSFPTYDPIFAAIAGKGLLAGVDLDEFEEGDQ